MAIRAMTVALIVGVSACSSKPPAPPKVSANLSFHTKWWSEAQMAQFNPNAPPPKATDIALAKWEYTDPVGTPHPDSVDLVVELHNDGEEAVQGLTVDASVEWQIGPQKSEARAAWRGAMPPMTLNPPPIAPGATAILRMPIDLVTQMAQLEKTEDWPFAARATVFVHVAGTAMPLLSRQVVLPIRPGD